MTLISCSECQRKISDKAESCPGCGINVAKAEGSPLRKVGVGLGIVAVIGIAFITQTYGPAAQARSSEREAIKQCREQQQRKSFTPAENHYLIAMQCERKEAEFRTKWKENP